MSNYIANKGFNVDAIDYAEEMIKIAKAKYNNVNFHVMDMRNISLTKKYDGIMLLILQEGIGEKNIKENLSKDLMKFVNFYTFKEMEEVLKRNKLEVLSENRKKSIGENALPNDKLIIICQKKTTCE